MRILSFRSGKKQAGFSLIDVMVGMVLGLIGTIIIFQVFEVSERVKRTTTSGGDAQQNGVAALFALERGVKQAGYGYNASDVLGLAPLAITQGAANNKPDSVTVRYRPSNPADCPATVLAQNCVWEYGPFTPNGNTVFMSQTPGVLTPPALTILNYCLILNLVNKPVLVSRTIPCAGVPAGGDPNDVILAEGIAQFKAAPMLDNTGAMIGVQMVVVARSAQPEKLLPPIDTPCDFNSAQANPNSTITQVSPTWLGAAVDLSDGIGLVPNVDHWQCYRYKMFNVTIPLRNVLWKP